MKDIIYSDFLRTSIGNESGRKCARQMTRCEAARDKLSGNHGIAHLDKVAWGLVLPDIDVYRAMPRMVTIHLTVGIDATQPRNVGIATPVHGRSILKQ